MPNLDFSSGYGAYDTTGKLIKGDLKGYGELAEQLDVKRVAFYLESGREGVILGCRFIVQILGGREERALFIAQYPIEEINWNTILRFYEKGEKEIESLERPRYKVLGLWRERDIEGIERVKSIKSTDHIYEFVASKLVMNDKITVKTSDLFKGVSLVAMVVQELKPVLPLGFKFAVSKSPFDADLLVRPEEPRADVDLDMGESKIRYEDASRFRKFYQIYKEQIHRQAGDYRFKDREELEAEIMRIAIRDYTSDICRLYQRDMNKLFQFCMGNSDDLIRVINQIVEDELAVSGIDAGTAVEVIMRLAPRIYGKGYEKVESFLLGLYKSIEGSHKKELQEFLIRENILWEEVVRDVAKRIAEERDGELLRIIGGKSFGDARTAKRFARGVRDVVDSLSSEEALSLLKFVLDELGWESREGGEILVKALYNMLGYTELTRLKERYRRKLSEFGITLPITGVERERGGIKRAVKKALMIFVVGLIVFAVGVGVGGHYELSEKIPYLTYILPLSSNISYSPLEYALISDAPLNITASVLLENKGNNPEDYIVALEIDNKTIDYEEVTLKPNENKEVSCESTLLEGKQDIERLKPVKLIVLPENGNYSILNFKLIAGAPLKIRASTIIENRGNIAGEYNATLRTENGFVYHNSGRLNANEKTTIGFEYTLLEAEKYDVTKINELIMRINELKSCKVEVTFSSSSEG